MVKKVKVDVYQSSVRKNENDNNTFNSNDITKDLLKFFSDSDFIDNQKEKDDYIDLKKCQLHLN